MAVPTIYAEGLFDKLDEFMLEFKDHDLLIRAGVASVGAAAAYAEVWEWGNVRQKKKGPKTVKGTNPDGDKVWMSSQAPTGYIKIHEGEYLDILKEEIAKCKFAGPTAKDITVELQAAGKRAMKRCARLIGESAPVDTGDLSKSFVVVEDGDNLLDQENDRSLNLE